MIVVSFNILFQKPEGGNVIIKLPGATIEGLREIIKSHFISENNGKIVIYGTNPYKEKKIKDKNKYHHWKWLGITPQDPKFQLRRNNIMSELTKLPIKLAMINVTISIENEKGKKEPREIDFAFIDEKGVLHIGEFMSSSPVGRINHKNEILNTPKVFEGVKDLLNKYLPKENSIKNTGNFYFFTGNAPKTDKLKVNDNVFFIKYEGTPDNAKFEWKPINQKDLKR